MPRLLPLLVLCGLISANVNASDLEESLKEHVENYYEVFNKGEANKLDPKEFSRGFGFRTQSARTELSLVPDAIEDWGIKKLIGLWLSSMEYYRGYIEDVHYGVDGNVGMAWGFHIEEFKSKDKFAEKIRVRFSSTYLYSDETKTWRALLSHRDIQNFDSEGNYIPTYGKP